MATSGLTGLLKRHWLLAAACAVLGAVIAVWLALFVVTPSYSATVTLYVSGAGTTADDRLQSGEYARAHVASYAEMVDSNDVLVAVRDNLGLPQPQDGSYRDLADRISAENPLDTLIIAVTVEDSSPQRAQAVAAAIGEVYDSVVARLESPSSAKQSPVRIRVVSPPALPTAYDSPSKKLYAVAGLLAGLAVGAGAGWLLELWSATRRRRWMINQTSGDSWSWWPGQDSSPSTAEAKESGLSTIHPSEHRGTRPQWDETRQKKKPA